MHGDNLALTATAITDFGTTTTGSWEIETETAGTFAELASPYTARYTYNNKKLRYKATNDCGTVYSNEVVVSVTKKPLEASAPTVTSSKVYDGNASAAITAGTLSGVLDGDDVTLIATATYNNANVGTDKTITVTYSLEGTDAGNYTKPIDDEITNGEIVEAPMPKVDNQTYCEGETANRLTAEINTLFAPESEYDLIWYDSNKTLLAEAPTPTTAMKPGDKLKSDYVYYVTQKNKTTLAESGFATITVSILAHPSISDISAPASAVHGGSLVLTAHEVAYSGTISASSWEIETGTAGTFAELASPYNVTFADNGKKLRYMATTGCGTSYSNEVAITVTKKQLEASTPTVTTSKVYDGNASAAVTAGTLSGVLDGDDVTFTATATYDTKEVGSSKTITVTYSLEGADAGNYIAPSDYTTSGEITSISLAIGQIEAPAAICSGNALTLSEPTVEDRGFAYTGRWEISGDDFNTSTVYLGQELKEEQNGWSLRYAAESSYGTFYSNVVKITVNLDPSYIGMMWDDVLVCSNAKEIQFTAWQWYYNGSAIDGATKAFYSSPSIGVGYQVAATAQDGRTYFSCPLSGNLKSQSVSIKSYPNPSLASEPMKIEVTGLSDELLKGATLTAYSAAGVQVLSLNNVSEINEIRLPQGIYVVVLRANGRTLSTKVMRR